MPFINSKVSVETTNKQRQELKTRLGEAIATIPGKSESWLMVNLEDRQEMYFRGENKESMAFISVYIHGKPDPESFKKLTAELTKIYGEVLGIKPDYMYVKYEACMDWGWNGTNF